MTQNNNTWQNKGKEGLVQRVVPCEKGKGYRPMHISVNLSLLLLLLL